MNRRLWISLQLFLLYVLGVEWIYLSSKISVFSNLPFRFRFSAIFDIWVAGTLVITVIAHLLSLGRNYGRLFGLLLLLVLTLVPAIHIDRWVYSTQGTNFATRPVGENLFFVALAAVVCIKLYKDYSTTLAAWADRNWSRLARLGILLFAAAVWNVWSKSLPDHQNLSQFLGDLPPRASPIEKLPRIILLTYDSFELHHTPFLKYERQTTPYLWKNQNKFTTFTRAISVAVESRSGTVALLTGRSPSKTHVTRDPDQLQSFDQYVHLPRILKHLGYQVVNLGREPYTNPIQFQMKDGFTEVNGKSLQEKGYSSSDLLARLAFRLPDEAYFLGETLSDYRISIQALFGHGEELRERRKIALVQKSDPKFFPEFLKTLKQLNSDGKPYFIHFHSTVTHPPFIQMGMKQYSKHLSDSCEEKRINNTNCNGKPLTDQDQMDLYDDALLQMDHEVQQVIELLEKQSAWRNTIFILTTDHELGSKADAQPVALFVHLPETAGATWEKSVGEQVWLLDIVPTLTDYLGFGTRKWMEGQSLLKLMQGDLAAKETSQNRILHTDDGWGCQVVQYGLLKYPYWMRARISEAGTLGKYSLYNISQFQQNLLHGPIQLTPIEETDSTRSLFQDFKSSVSSLIEDARCARMGH